MIKTAVLTASGIVENVGCQVHSVNVTKAGTTSTVDIYDETSATGNKIWSGDGAVVQSCSIGNFAGGGVGCVKGCYVNISGTPGVVVVTYE